MGTFLLLALLVIIVGIGGGLVVGWNMGYQAQVLELLERFK